MARKRARQDKARPSDDLPEGQADAPEAPEAEPETLDDSIATAMAEAGYEPASEPPAEPDKAAEEPEGQPEAEVEAPAPAEGEDAVAEAEALDVRRMIADAGLQHDFADDATAVKSLIEARRKLSQRDDEAKHWRDIQPWLPEFSKWAQDRQQAARAEGPPQARPQPGADAGPQIGWDPPVEWRPEMDDWIEQDPETGQPRAKAGAPPEALGEYQRHRAYADQRWRRWYNDPTQMVIDLVVPVVQYAVGQQGQQLTAQQQAARAGEQFLAEHRSLLVDESDPQNLRATPVALAIQGICQTQRVTPPQALEMLQNAGMVPQAAAPAPAEPSPTPEPPSSQGQPKPRPVTRRPQRTAQDLKGVAPDANLGEVIEAVRAMHGIPHEPGGF